MIFAKTLANHLGILSTQGQAAKQWALIVDSFFIIRGTTKTFLGTHKSFQL